jgi:hypothetical protein
VLVGPLEVLGEINLDGVKVADVDCLKAQSINFNTNLNSALEVVLVIDLGKVTYK